MLPRATENPVAGHIWLASLYLLTLALKETAMCRYSAFKGPQQQL